MSFAAKRPSGRVPRRRIPGHASFPDVSHMSIVLPPRLRKDGLTMSKEYIRTSASTSAAQKEQIVAYVRRAPQGRSLHHQRSIESGSTADDSHGANDAGVTDNVKVKRIFSTATSTASNKYNSGGTDTSTRSTYNAHRERPLRARRASAGSSCFSTQSVFDGVYFRNGLRVQRWQGLAKGKNVGGLLPSSSLREDARLAIRNWFENLVIIIDVIHNVIVD